MTLKIEKKIILKKTQQNSVPGHIRMVVDSLMVIKYHQLSSNKRKLALTLMNNLSKFKVNEGA